MLHQFTFKNFRSFKNEATLNLLASSIKEHSSDVVIDLGDEQVLKVAAIYGANASGKSNVLEAFSAMRNLVTQSFLKEIGFVESSIKPFWFEKPNIPTEFSVIFSEKENIYQYGFSVLNNEIIEEYLFKRDLSVKKEKYKTIFIREDNKFNGDLLNDLSEKFVFDLVENNTLLISVLAKLKLLDIQHVYKWFKDIQIVNYGSVLQEFKYSNLFSSPYANENRLVKLLEDKKEKRKLENFINAIDVGISKLGVLESSQLSLFDDEEQDGKLPVTYHKNPLTGKYRRAFLNQESSGTQKMISLYLDMKTVLENGGTLFVDELDAKLHPLLIRYIIIMFHDKETNPQNAQIIFSTQEVFTLDKENLRRDEIWFVDKDENGISDLYSLVDYVDDEDKKIRNDASYGKDYILGRYKSIPSLKRMEELDGEETRKED